MKLASIVVGANWGDEGKGLVTTALEPELVVLCNGGPQRGHTCWRGNDRFVVHHFGSGVVNDAVTYISKDFCVNPLAFVQEHRELLWKKIKPKTLVNEDALVTFPQDMTFNRETEKELKHGSCGMGVWATVQRNKSDRLAIKDLYTREKYDEAFDNLNAYYGVKDVGTTREHFYDDLSYFLDNVSFSNDRVLKTYDEVVFEMGQGLMLSADNAESFPHVTGSYTGCRNADNVLDGICYVGKRRYYYVTRTYATKHGTGPFPGELNKDDLGILESVVDETNVPNEFQGELRYGFLDPKELLARCTMDANGASSVFIVATHANETDGKFLTKRGLISPDFVDIWSYDERLKIHK